MGARRRPTTRDATRSVSWPPGTTTSWRSKNGFVDAVYGQRRPLQPGTPVALADAQAVADVDLRLTRGGVITGHRARRGRRSAAARAGHRAALPIRPGGNGSSGPRARTRPTTAGSTACSDCRPATTTSARRTTRPRRVDRPRLTAARGGPRRAGRPRRRPRSGAALGPLSGSDEPEPTGYAPTYYPGVVSAPEAGKVTVGPGQEVGRHRLPDPARPPRHRQRHRRRRGGCGAGHVDGGRRRRTRTARRADADGPIAGGRHVHHLQRAARPLCRHRAIARAQQRSQNGDAVDRRQRAEHRRRVADPSAGRHALGQHHRGIVRHAGADRLFGIPYRRARRDAAAVRRRWWRGGGGGRGGPRRAAGARKRTAPSRSATCSPASTTSALPAAPGRGRVRDRDAAGTGAGAVDAEVRARRGTGRHRPARRAQARAERRQRHHRPDGSHDRNDRHRARHAGTRR